MIIVPTIRNTGSHFVLRLLGVKQPWRPAVLTWRGAERATDSSIVFDHVFPHQKALFLPLIRDHLTIVPLRHPKLTAKSWADRQHVKSDLVGMWRVLVDEIDPLGPFYLPLDVPDREDYLDALRERTGLPLLTDWAPAGSQHGNSELRHTDINATPEIEVLCERINPFLSRFYG